MKRINLKELKPWGRNASEYEAMFDLRLDRFSSIASFADGPSSLQADRPHLNITSFDPIYQFSVSEIQDEIERISGSMLRYLEDHVDHYHWNFFNHPKEVIASRLKTATSFLEHYKKHPQKYITTILPKLEIESTFDLSLCSHFLFLYSNELSTEDHILTITSIMKHTNELRIFPLVDLHGQTSRHLTAVLDFLQECEYNYAILPTKYRFQKGAYHYLRIYNP